MTDRKATPGPWRVGRMAAFDGTIFDAKDEQIAQCHSPTEGRRSANARLIAAAPDLYAALHELLAQLCLHGSINTESASDLMEAGFSALDKARGE
jgi:hypothetical protein